MRRSTLLVLAAMLAAGCSDELSDREVADAVMTHLTELAPNRMAGSKQRVSVVEILQPSETRRDARFRVEDDSTSTAVLTAHFTKSDRGWALSGYGPQLSETIAWMVALERYADFADLVEALDTVASAASRWIFDTNDRASDILVTNNFRAYEELRSAADRGPDSTDIAPALAHLTVEWGAIEGFPGIISPAVFVRAEGVTCATLYAIGNDDRPPADVYWIVDGKPTCERADGTHTTVDIYLLADRIAEEIIQSGGVLQP